MAGRGDDVADAQIRVSEDLLRESVSSPAAQPQQRPPHRTNSLPYARQLLPYDDVPPPRYTPPPRTSELYTIQSRTESPPQPGATLAAMADEAAALNSTPNPASASLAVPRQRPPSGNTTSSSTHQQRERNHLSRTSGVSFADPPVSGDDDGMAFKAPSKIAGIRMSSKSARLVETSETIAHYRDWVRRQRKRQRLWASGPYGRFKTRTAALYQKYIIEGLLRQRPLPPSADGRHIPLDPGRVRRTPLIDERTNQPYISNFIRSSRYTLWDFLPRQLLFQFMKLANFYFLIISILQMIPGLSTTGKYTTILPLMGFVAISMGKEGYDDYRRYRMDRVENRSTAWVLDPGHTTSSKAGLSKDGRWLRLRPRSWTSEKKMPWVAWNNNNANNAGNDDSAANEAAGSVNNAAGMTELDSVPSPEDESAARPSLALGLSESQGTTSRQRMPWAAVTWQNVRVGDIIRLQRDESVPADVLLLHASGPNGVAYIETMALDGETNLKTKQASPLLFEQCESLAGMAALNAEIVSEDPNLDLYNYEGRVIANGETMPLTLHQIIFRGSIVRNTAEAIGIVVNTGEECKIRMNTHRHKHAKAPEMQGVVNRIVILLVIFVALLSMGCTIGYGVWQPHMGNYAWYLNSVQLTLAEIFFAFIIMFNTLIPLSLYVSLEIIKIGQVLLLQDVEMYDPDTDTPMVANTTTILENLGQVSYIFSDKTGTLTENKMRFRKMSVAGTAWLHDMDITRDAEEKEKRRQSMFIERRATGLRKSFTRRRSMAAEKKARISMQAENAAAASSSASASASADAPLLTEDGPMPRRSMSQWRSPARPHQAQPELKTEDLIQYIRHRPHTAFSRKARHFILCIALCHTCLPETMDDGRIEFQAASPDELALVQAARDLGYLLIDRPAQSIKLQFQQLDGTTITETYQVLDVIEFSSKRKRMSIVIRMPDGRICLFCKGADTTIMPRLKLSQMAFQKASAIERRASKRKSVEQEHVMRRKSLTAVANTPRSSLNLVRAGAGAMNSSLRGIARASTAKNSADFAAYRRSGAFSGDVDDWLTLRETEDLDVEASASGLVRRSSGLSSHGYRDNESAARSSSVAAAKKHWRAQDEALATAAAGAAESLYDDGYGGLVDEALALNDGAVFERCFQHIDDFASEGLRTLLFAYRYVEEDDYHKWKAIYQDAETSLVNRQERIESAADLLEQGFDLAGATAIEDKLQEGVPETIDKMRRANIKIWMLTGDKRETAINIAHAARICKSYSEIYVLDAAAEKENLQERIASTLVDVGRGMMPHSVVVIDGHTLGVVEADEEMRVLFFDLVARVDSVICCRASPSQKATLVTCIRQRVHASMTLAIGDGANDIAMIQASHVGIGISGREGLQAARISDYSIAQFRFLQRLLLVHGRWNYIRTGKYILGTFWKELLFYLVQALYQQYNGYTGTSLYESTSLAVFNTLFTSLPVILMGIFEKDLSAETLLAVPELYTFGHKNQAFNVRKYVGWMVLAVCEAVIIYYVMYGNYIRLLFTSDASLYAMGSLAFTDCVVFINVKMLILELHNKTIISMAGFAISVIGWFLWNILLALVYPEKNGPYLVRGTFLHNFGRVPTWWLTTLAALVAVVGLELIVTGLRRVYFSTDQDLMQEIEHYEDVRAIFKEHAAELGEAEMAEPATSPADEPTEAKQPLSTVTSAGNAEDEDPKKKKMARSFSMPAEQPHPRKSMTASGRLEVPMSPLVPFFSLPVRQPRPLSMTAAPPQWMEAQANGDLSAAHSGRND